jgi:hypothetical protein
VKNIQMRLALFADVFIGRHKEKSYPFVEKIPATNLRLGETAGRRSARRIQTTA